MAAHALHSVAHALRAAWLLGYRPKAFPALPVMRLSDIVAKVNMSFQELRNFGRPVSDEIPPLTNQSVRQMPVAEVGGSSSSAGDAPASAVPQAAADAAPAGSSLDRETRPVQLLLPF